MPNFQATRRVSRGSRDNDAIARIREGQQRRRQEVVQEEKAKTEDKEKDREWEDSMVQELELYFNAVFALVFISLPASEDPPDWMLSGVVLVFNVLWNWLVFRSTWIDRLNLYVFNIVLVNSGEFIRRYDELPGWLPLLNWNFVLQSNVLFIALGWWYKVRPLPPKEREWPTNVLGMVWFVGNVAVLLYIGIIQPHHIYRYLGALKKLLLSGSLAPE
eukprot:Hpha_TRINITY_DN15463_c1_g2::TRINITY_DN15463_c1_g2_i1::g.175389::m.175389